MMYFLFLVKLENVIRDEFIDIRGGKGAFASHNHANGGNYNVSLIKEYTFKQKMFLKQNINFVFILLPLCKLIIFKALFLI